MTSRANRIPRVAPTRLGIWARLHRWWEAGKLRAEVTAANCDLAENELAQHGLMSDLRLANEEAATLLRGRLELLRCEAITLQRLRARALQQLDALETGQ